MAFLDVSGAFDNVRCDILLRKLSSIGCSENLVRFIHFLTYSREIFTDSLDNEYRTIGKGVPQGEVLSPLLYLIYVKDITSGISRNVTVSQFADDTAVYCNIASLKKCKKALEKAINNIQKNISELGLQFAPHKTVFIHFNKL